VVSRNGRAVGLEARAPSPLADDPVAAREILLSHLGTTATSDWSANHAHPAIDIRSSATWSDRPNRRMCATSASGRLARDFAGRSSLRATDLIEHQLARARS
jgi:hypothetical protein